MMGNYGSFGWLGGGSLVGLHLHWFLWMLAFFGLVAGLIWLVKYASKDDFLKMVWITLVVGVLGGLLTAPFSLLGWGMQSGMMGGTNSWGSRYPSMMGEMIEHFEDDWEEIEGRLGENASREDMENEMEEHMEEMFQE